MTLRFEWNRAAAAQNSPGPLADNLIYSPTATGGTARERFLAQHGPEAKVPRRPATPKAIRRALLAAEMACWEGF